MIGYCPLEEEPPVRQPQVAVAIQPEPRMGFEETECNYIVMAFIAGVLILAITDSMQK